MLNKTSLIDASSTKPTWVSMWLSLFNDFLKAVSAERFFISFSTCSQIFGPKWVCDSVPYTTVQTG